MSNQNFSFIHLCFVISKTKTFWNVEYSQSINNGIHIININFAQNFMTRANAKSKQLAF